MWRMTAIFIHITSVVQRCTCITKLKYMYLVYVCLISHVTEFLDSSICQLTCLECISASGGPSWHYGYPCWYINTCMPVDAVLIITIIIIIITGSLTKGYLEEIYTSRKTIWQDTCILLYSHMNPWYFADLHVHLYIAFKLTLIFCPNLR